jgi:hypothetical protein
LEQPCTISKINDMKLQAECLNTLLSFVDIQLKPLLLVHIRTYAKLVETTPLSVHYLQNRVLDSLTQKKRMARSERDILLSNFALLTSQPTVKQKIQIPVQHELSPVFFNCCYRLLPLAEKFFTLYCR